MSLHNHTSFSLYDAVGYPGEYFKNVFASGGDALAITDHGNMNSLGFCVSAAKEMRNRGMRFRPIFGIEAYVIPSLQSWHALKHGQPAASDENVIEDSEDSKNTSRWYDPLNKRHHLVIFALNNSGLQNLFRLVSRSYRPENFYRFPRIDFDLLRNCNDGLAISTACVAGLPAWLSLQDPGSSQDAVMERYDRKLLPLLEIFGRDRAFLELQFNALPEQNVVNKHLIEFSKRTGFNLIAASDAHYCKKDLWKEREIYRVLGRQVRGQEFDPSLIPQSVADLKCELYPHTADEIFAASQKYCPDLDPEIIKNAINRTHDIAWQLASDVSPDATIKLPAFACSKEQTPFDHLKSLCLDQLKQRGLAGKKEYVDRTIFELGVIKDKGVAEYFLTKKSILDVLRKKLLLGVGRGSGAGSLVNYLLNITLADPIKAGLLFERFISPSRQEMPDIDSDCEDKDIAFELLKNEFGADSVVAISNYNRLKLKSLVKDIAKLHGVPFSIVNHVTKVVEDEAKPAIMKEIGHDQKLYELSFEKAMEHSPTFNDFITEYPKVGESISVLFKSVKAISKHAGGVLIVPDAEKHMPIIRIRNVNQCPFTEGLTAQHLKHFGLVKFDVLGLSTLKIIRRCIELIIMKWGTPEPNANDVWDFYNQYLHPDVIDQSDAKVFENVYHRGRFPCIFQFAERGVQQFVMKAKPKNVMDLGVITSIWRPGPLQGSADKIYLKNRETAPVYDHPILEEVLSESLNVLSFQEHFLKLAHKLAGFSLDEADQLRKLLVKPSQELGEEMKQKRIEAGERFIAGCIEKGLSPERAHRLWHDEILGFVSYGFSSSHAHVYALNSFHCAWLFSYFEEEWVKACLEKAPDLEKAISSITALGSYQISKPCINRSLADRWQIENGKCIPPFNAIKGIGSIAAKELVAVRPLDGFRTFSDFLWSIDANGLQKWRWSKLSKSCIASLLSLEAFEALEDFPFANAQIAHDFAMQHFKDLKKGTVSSGRGKKRTVANLRISDLPMPDLPDFPTHEKIKTQKDLLGAFDKGLLFTGKVQKFIDEHDIPSFQVAEEDAKMCWFFLVSRETAFTARGKEFLKLKISDGCGNMGNLNVFQSPLPDLQTNSLFAARLVRKDNWLNLAGKIHKLQ